MLVLSRRPGQIIEIGPNIRVVVVDVRGGKVRLGIEAPANVAVNREEVQAAIERERKAGLVEGQV